MCATRYSAKKNAAYDSDAVDTSFSRAAKTAPKPATVRRPTRTSVTSSRLRGRVQSRAINSSRAPYAVDAAHGRAAAMRPTRAAPRPATRARGRTGPRARPAEGRDEHGAGVDLPVQAQAAAEVERHALVDRRRARGRRRRRSAPAQPGDAEAPRRPRAGTPSSASRKARRKCVAFGGVGGAAARTGCRGIAAVVSMAARAPPWRRRRCGRRSR